MQDSRFTSGRSIPALLARLALAATGTTLLFAGIAQASAPAHPPRDGDVVTSAQAKKAAAAYFTKLDVNGDGKLDSADRVAAREQVRATRFDALDANHDGTISKVEFVAGKAGAEGFRANGFPGGQRDDDHRGRFAPRPAVSTEAAMQVLSHFADTNHDGSISRAEFTAAAEKRFAMIDANHDGKITRDERHDAREAIVSQRRDNWNADKATAN